MFTPDFDIEKVTPRRHAVAIAAIRLRRLSRFTPCAIPHTDDTLRHATLLIAAAPGHE